MSDGRSLAIVRRHDALVELIRAGGYSSPDMATMPNVLAETIYWDIDFLERRGCSVCYQRHTPGWVYHLLAEPATVSTEKSLSAK